MSQLCLRLLATALFLGQVCALGTMSAQAAAGPNTWQQLASIPTTLESPVEALAVDPANPLLVVAGTQDGSVYRSVDAGAHWVRTGHGLGRAVTALTFNPGVSGEVLAGSTGAGIWASTDSGATWQAVPGTRDDDVRAITAGDGLLAAGTREGVLLSTDGKTWNPAGLPAVDISALAILAGGTQPTVLAGGDGELTGQPLPLYLTQDGGSKWTSESASVTGSTLVSSLLVLPPAQGAAPTVLLGTNGGLFQSTDGGVQWTADNAGGALPPVDVTALAAGSTGRTYYVASDGGASTSGGLWVTRDGGGTFSSLRAPQPAVTALAVVPANDPVIYAASLRPLDHAVMFWNYTDAGGIPQAPATPVAGPQQGAAASNGADSTINWVRTLSQGPEMPFLVVAAFAVLVLLVALGSYARSARRL